MDPCTPITIAGPDDATITVCAYGGQLLSWAPSFGSKRLYLSPAYECGDGKAIRGGVPVIFPQFSGRGPLPKHGLARDRAWTMVAPDPPAAAQTSAAWAAELTSDDATLAIWPHPFRLRIDVQATQRDLKLALSVVNTGQAPFTFAAALHTYLTVTSDDATISGLSRSAREDNARVGQIEPAPADEPDWVALAPRDVRVLDVPGPVEFRDPGQRGLVITGHGFADRVVWNPGPHNGIGDIPDGDERRFVCIEPAQVTPVELQAGQSWRGAQEFRIDAE